MKKHVALIILLGLLGLSVGAASPRPRAADISGTWEFLLHLNKGTKPVIFVLKQQGEKIKGTCCTPEEIITGSVRGDKVTFEYESSREGKTQRITYSGTFETPTKINGTRTIIRDTDQIQQKWTATRQDR